MPGRDVILNLEYQEAESKFSSKIIKENHKILNSAIGNLENSILICEYPELEINPMRTQVFYITPEFLESPSDYDLKELKNQIDLYKSQFESLCQKLNNYIGNFVVIKLKSLYGPSDKMKNEINEIIQIFVVH